MNNVLRRSSWFLLTCALALAVEPKRPLYVVNSKPLSIAIVDQETFKKTGEIPIEKYATNFVLAPDGRHLYFLRHGEYNLYYGYRGEARLVVVDLNAQKVLKDIPCGRNGSKLEFSGDRKYLLCFSRGSEATKKAKREEAMVTVVNAATNEVAATLSAGRLAKGVLFSKDLSRILVLSGREVAKKGAKPSKAAVTVFTLDKEQPLAATEFDQDLAQMVLSEDEKWLYVMDGGTPNKNPQKNHDGTVHVLDVTTGKLAGSHGVGSAPRNMIADKNTAGILVLAQNSVKDLHGKMYEFRGGQPVAPVEVGQNPLYLQRFGSLPGRFAVSHSDMRFFPDNGPASTAPIALNGAATAAETADSKSLHGYPGEMLYFPEHNKVATLVRNARGETSKVAIMNLAKNQVEHVITTGRGGVKFGKVMGMVALSVAMSAASYYGGYYSAQATGSPFFTYNVYAFTPAPVNVELSSSPDGRFLYALNTFSNDVTIVNIADGAVVDKVPFGGHTLRRIGAGNRLLGYTGNQVNFIDTKENKKVEAFKLASGRINDVEPDEAGNRLIALTSKSLVFLDAEKGSVISTVDGFGDALFVVHAPKEP
ncbi:MAG: hypothetical protein HY013_07750 [Candidatus Solibacter usitatus]|nr:hypothetical protein [Candidatus Solibacter usitatus]